MNAPIVAAETPLSVRHVSRRFGGVVAVDDVSFDLLPGERRVILGPNGAGKTTLFNVIGGQDRPNTGQLYAFGRDITRLSVHARAGLGLARTFQITNVFPNLSVEENVLLAVQALRPTRMVMYRPLRSYAGLNARAEHLLQEWGLWDKRNLAGRNLSHGDRRLLEIVMALHGQPRLLLLDEPTAGLSTEEQHRVAGVIASLDPAITILLIEHNMDVAFEIASWVTVMHHGKIVADGPPGQVKEDPVVLGIYLGATDDRGVG
jgi:branched-chain amino acid transport system ATP-binding protein